MGDDTPEETARIIQILLRGYQFSDADLFKPGYDRWYNILDRHFDWFREHLSLSGFSLRRDHSVIFLEKENKLLSQEEKQIVVVLFLLTDLWLEKGKSFGDLFQLSVSWTELDWFRDGYGREYLGQVGIEMGDDGEMEQLFRRLSNKGFLEYSTASRTLTLRRPAERLINMARRLHRQIQAAGVDARKEEARNHE
ncbi:MAG: hypothetical protein FP816_15775 [Desulfobacteraceae bacterium]|nr:hypothetical protein [Desulfobacteraceae bacterium]MBU3948980.1 hypothetical protein [Pseudomonadota bacterium]